MVDALTPKGDEGRSVAAISDGELPSKLWSVDVRMGKPHRANLYDLKRKREERTQGSKTFQYLEEEKTIVIAWVAASESAEA